MCIRDRIKNGIAQACETAVEALKRISKPVEDKQSIAQVASISADVYKRQTLSALLSLAGRDGSLPIRPRARKRVQSSTR